MYLKNNFNWITEHTMFFKLLTENFSLPLPPAAFKDVQKHWDLTAPL